MNAPEHAAAMHFRQGLVDGFLPFENAEKRRIGLRRAAKLIVDQIQMLAQQLAGFVRQLAVIFLRVVENTNEIFRGLLLRISGLVIVKCPLESRIPSRRVRPNT